MPRGGHPAPDSSRKSSRLRAPPEHKIVVFVRFLPSGPPFSGISSTKRAFLCQKWQLFPGFGPFRAQNRGFCALFAFETPVFGLFEHKIGIFVSETAIFPWFWPLPSTKLGFLCAFASKFLPDSAPASNKPHSAEKRTPVWLAIWRIWAGFANSQLRRAAFRCTYSYICTHPRYCCLEHLLRQTQIFRPICTDCLRHLRISAG